MQGKAALLWGWGGSDFFGGVGLFFFVWLFYFFFSPFGQSVCCRGWGLCSAPLPLQQLCPAGGEGTVYV